MKTLLVLLVVLVVAGGLYTLVAGGVGGLVGAGRSKASGDDDPFDGPTDLRRAPGDR
jgi:hypothetical protein